MRIRLTNRQWDALDHMRNTTGSADVFRNCSVLLLSDGGHSLAGVAQLLGCSPDTVKRVRSLYREGGLDAVTLKRPPRRASQATPTFREVLAQVIQTNPQTLGNGFATWSAARLATHLGRVTGVTLSAAQVRRPLHAGGFSVHRPKHAMNGKRDELPGTLAAVYAADQSGDLCRQIAVKEHAGRITKTHPSAVCWPEGETTASTSVTRLSVRVEDDGECVHVWDGRHEQVAREVLLRGGRARSDFSAK
jgi:transposase